MGPSLASQAQEALARTGEVSWALATPVRREWLVLYFDPLQVEKGQDEVMPSWDAKNPLCPRVLRANGEVS